MKYLRSTFKCITLGLLTVLVCCGCDDDDGPTLTADYCTEELPTEGCFERPSEDDFTIEEFEQWLIGDWREVARATSGMLGGPTCTSNESVTTTFSFSADGVYTYELADGSTGMTNYAVTLLCGTFPPCLLEIMYEDGGLDFYPSLVNVCQSGLAWFDARPVDGDLEVYQRQ